MTPPNRAELMRNILVKANDLCTGFSASTNTDIDCEKCNAFKTGAQFVIDTALADAEKEIIRLHDKYDLQLLVKQLAEAQKDSSRLEWMIKNKIIIEKDTLGKYEASTYGSVCNGTEHASPREAIDAEMKEQK